jgi:hypothetical protein
MVIVGCVFVRLIVPVAEETLCGTRLCRRGMSLCLWSFLLDWQSETNNPSQRETEGRIMALVPLPAMIHSHRMDGSPLVSIFPRLFALSRGRKKYSAIMRQVVCFGLENIHRNTATFDRPE